MDVSPGGIVTVNQATPSSYPTKYIFEDGTRVILEAIPDHRYVFSDWSGTLIDTANPAIIVMNCNQKVTANFSLNKPLLVELVGITVVIGSLIIASIIVRYRLC